MARPLRLEFPGAIYHVTARGNARAAIFLDDHDRELFLDLLARVVKRYEWICHAYCLMGNHHHLLIETPRPSLAAGMRQLNGVYAQRFNHRHGRVGHVFGERFKSVLVERDTHLVTAAAYIRQQPRPRRALRNGRRLGVLELSGDRGASRCPSVPHGRLAAVAVRRRSSCRAGPLSHPRGRSGVARAGGDPR